MIQTGFKEALPLELAAVSHVFGHQGLFKLKKLSGIFNCKKCAGGVSDQLIGWFPIFLPPSGVGNWFVSWLPRLLSFAEIYFEIFLKYLKNGILAEGHQNCEAAA